MHVIWAKPLPFSSLGIRIKEFSSVYEYDTSKFKLIYLLSLAILPLKKQAGLLCDQLIMYQQPSHDNFLENFGKWQQATLF